METGLYEEFQVTCLDVPVDFLLLVIGEPRQTRNVNAGRKRFRGLYRAHGVDDHVCKRFKEESIKCRLEVPRQVGGRVGKMGKG